MDKYECSICDNIFDSASHRPRSLPCGHGFCTQCIEACIRRGNKSCPVCKEVYQANSAKHLPVNYLLEEMLQKAAISPSENHTKDLIGMCPKHRKVPLYFLCTSHNVQVCHSCVVIDHPATSCDLISLHEEIKKKKDLQILSVQKEREALRNIELELIVLNKETHDFISEQESNKKELEKEVELLLTKIEQLTQEIFETGKTKKQISDAITYSRTKQGLNKLRENCLRLAINIEDIEKNCKIAARENLESQKWEELLRKELNMKKKSKDKYVMLKRDGIVRSSKVISEGCTTLIPNLCYRVDPPSSATLIKESKLKLRSGSTIVFMEFDAGGCHLGRVYIDVFSNRPYGQQFIMLALGTHGDTFKGATFQNRWHKESVGLVDYITEDGLRSDRALLEPLYPEYFEIPSRGMLFPYREDEPSASFVIFTRDLETNEEFGYFAEVISGMEVIDRIASTEFKIRTISISECGIVLNY